MTIERNDDSTLSGASHLVTGSITRELNGIVAGAVELWEGGAEPDAGKLLEAYPQFREHPSLALELVYEEYCHHREAGEAIDVSVFCQRFSWLSSSLRRMIEVHDVFETREPAKREIRWPSEGDEICGFRIVARIGTGSFSRVYVAKQIELGDRLVTIKVAEMVYDEARFMGRLSHEAIVPVLSVHHDLAAGLSVICMPYRGAATLEDVLNAIQAHTQLPNDGDFVCQVVASRNRALPTIETRFPLGQECPAFWQAIVQMALPIVDAIESAHSKGVIHRDIKPSNVLLAPLCQPQLLDFNLSADLQDTTSRVGGTISYMPLEQIEVLVGLRKASELTPAVDVYALGVVLYELLTGRLPFVFREVRNLRGALDTRRAAGLAGVPSPRNIHRNAPPELDAIVMQCLHDNATERPTPAQLRAKLNQVLLAPITQRQHRRRALFAGAIVLASGGIGGLLYNAVIGSSPAQPSGPPTIEQLVKQANQDLKADRVAEALASFQTAYRQERSPWLALGIAECLTRQANYREAKQYWSIAGSTVTYFPQTLNNQAYCLIKSFDYVRAHSLLNEACQGASHLQAVWLNRALAFVEGPGELWSSAEAKASIQKAIANGPPSVPLFFCAARVYARCCEDDPACREPGVDALRNAILHGFDTKNIDSLPWTEPLQSSPRFASLKQLTTTTSVSGPNLHLEQVLVPFPFPATPHGR